MSVRKRTWTTAKGEAKTAWIADYTDQAGERHIQTFERKKDADEYHATVKVDVRQGVHTAPSKSKTVAQAADDWIAFVKLEGRQRSTVDQYRQHADHINKRIGREKLAKLTTPSINAFRDDLLANMSRPLAKKVLTSLKSLLRDAKRRGNVAQNVAADVSIKIGKQGGVDETDIPTPDEIRRIINAAQGKTRPLLMVAAFAGLRASEMRGLRWSDVDLAGGKISVKQRADRFGKIGQPKSDAGKRIVPIGPMVVNTLREWRLRCPKGSLDLVFPTKAGTIENHSNIVQRILAPVQIAAGVVVPVLDGHGKPKLDADGKPVVTAKYPGLHSFRHFYASWCINRVTNGGLGLPIKDVQSRLGHASIVMTSDRYGHLFPSRDDGSELATAEKALFG